MNDYLENIVQNKNINFIRIYFGSRDTERIFTMTDLERNLLLEEFRNYRTTQIKCKYYQVGNKIKENNDYYKLVQVENDEIVKNNVFDVVENELQSLVLLFDKSKISSHEFPCKKEYDIETVQNNIEIDYLETIKIKLINDSNVLIEIIKDAYIDNTIRELEVLINQLKSLFTGNTCN